MAAPEEPVRPQQTNMKYKTVYLIFLLFILIGCDRNADINYASSKVSNLYLKEVIEKGWGINLLEIKELFPEGVLVRGDIRKRVAARYILHVIFDDIQAQGVLTFHQRERELREANNPSYPIRIILLKNIPKEQLNLKYEEVKEYIKRTYPKIFIIKNPPYYNEQYCIYEFDDKGDLCIGLKIDERFPEEIRIDITHNILIEKEP